MGAFRPAGAARPLPSADGRTPQRGRPRNPTLSDRCYRRVGALSNAGAVRLLPSADGRIPQRGQIRSHSSSTAAIGGWACNGMHRAPPTTRTQTVTVHHDDCHHVLRPMARRIGGSPTMLANLRQCQKEARAGYAVLSRRPPETERAAVGMCLPVLCLSK